MADFFERLAARIIGVATDLVRPDLPSRFAPSPAIIPPVEQPPATRRVTAPSLPAWPDSAQPGGPPAGGLPSPSLGKQPGAERRRGPRQDELSRLASPDPVASALAEEPPGAAQPVAVDELVTRPLTPIATAGEIDPPIPDIGQHRITPSRHGPVTTDVGGYRPDQPGANRPRPIRLPEARPVPPSPLHPVDQPPVPTDRAGIERSPGAAIPGDTPDTAATARLRAKIVDDAGEELPRASHSRREDGRATTSGLPQAGEAGSSSVRADLSPPASRGTPPVDAAPMRSEVATSETARAREAATNRATTPRPPPARRSLAPELSSPDWGVAAPSEPVCLVSVEIDVIEVVAEDPVAHLQAVVRPELSLTAYLRSRRDP